MRRLAILITTLFAALTVSVGGFPGSASAQANGPFTVFFERGSTELKPIAKAVLDEAAKGFLGASGATPTLIVGGHSDDADESAAAIESQMRANSVREYLVDQGVPATSIVTHAYGATRPLVETEKGVPEPLNRRVEVTLTVGSGR